VFLQDVGDVRQRLAGAYNLGRGIHGYRNGVANDDEKDDDQAADRAQGLFAGEGESTPSGLPEPR